MEVSFADDDLDRLETDPNFTNGLSPQLVRLYRFRMQFLRGAADERDLRNMKSLHYEKLKGNRQHQRSIRLNKQYRLILELEERDSGKCIRIIGIEDYH